MKYIGNYKEWINPALIDRILSTPGDPTLLNQPKNWVGHPAHEAWYKDFCKAGYNKLNFYSNMYMSLTEDIKDFKISVMSDESIHIHKAVALASKGF